jgi:hypothetical protein
MNTVETIPFPPSLRDRLQALRQRELDLIAGFLAGANLEGNWSLADDLSGVLRETPEQKENV